MEGGLSCDLPIGEYRPIWILNLGEKNCIVHIELIYPQAFRTVSNTKLQEIMKTVLHVMQGTIKVHPMDNHILVLYNITTYRINNSAFSFPLKSFAGQYI